jgi:Mor family transcriptional regulator
MEEDNQDVEIQDFPTDSLLLMVAMENIALACRLSEEFGGTTQYVHKSGFIKRGSRDREILKRVSKLESYASIARSLGVSHSYTRKIVRAEKNEHLWSNRVQIT